MARPWDWVGMMDPRAPAAVWSAPGTVLWLAALLALPALVVLAVSPALRMLLAQMATRRSDRPEAAYLTHPGFRWALLSMLGGSFAAWEGWYFLGRTDPSWLGRGSTIISPEPGLWAACYLVLVPGIGLAMLGYVAALGCSGESARDFVPAPEAVRQAWLASVGVLLFASALLALNVRLLLALPPLAGAALAMVVQYRRGMRLTAQAKVIARREHAAEAAALADHVPARGEYWGETVWRPMLRVGAVYVVAAGLFLLAGCLTLGPGATRELLRLWPTITIVLAVCGGLSVFLVVAVCGSRARHVLWDEEGIDVTPAVGRRRHLRWSELTSFSVHGRIAVVSADRRGWSLLASGDGFADLVVALKVRVWSRQAE